jgi:hypothetical protein
MKPTFLPLLAIFIALAHIPASAGPAPWYKWQSKLDASTACSQTPLGAGWERVAGPFRDSRCEKPGIIK